MGWKHAYVPCFVNYYMLMIKLVTQLDHSDWKTAPLHFNYRSFKFI